MKAVATIVDCFIDVNTPADNATMVIDFCATEDPTSGIVMKNISMLLGEAQMVVDIKQAVVDYINGQRGSVVIAVSDVRLP